MTRTNIAYAEMRIKTYEAKMTKAVQEANVAVEALKSAGALSAQMAADAMSAFSMGSNLNGSVNLNDSTQRTIE